MEHTQGTWRVTGTGTIRYIDVAVGNGMVQEVATCMRTEYGDMEANARRIVACINACSHIPTDRLEMAMPGQMKSSLDGLCDSVEQLTAQRDELLAVLDSIIDLHDSASRGKQVAETIGKARAVIQKVRGVE